MRARAAGAVGGSPVLAAVQADIEKPIRRPRRQDRETHHLRHDQTSNLLNAWDFAEHLGTPLDMHIVVQWKYLNLMTGQSIPQMQAAFLDRLSKWMRKQQKPFMYAWTIEFGRNKGYHTHLLLSGTRLDGSALGSLLRSLPKLLVGDDTPIDGRVIRVEPTKARLPYDRRRFDRISRSKNQQRGLISYICKGSHPDAAAKVGINAEDQGEVRFRRCGVSRSLDWSARRRAGWQEQTLDQFDFSDLAAKRRHSLEMAFQARAGAPPSPHPDRRAISDAGTVSGLYGRLGAPTAPGMP